MSDPRHYSAEAIMRTGAGAAAEAAGGCCCRPVMPARSILRYVRTVECYCRLSCPSVSGSILTSPMISGIKKKKKKKEEGGKEVEGERRKREYGSPGLSGGTFLSFFVMATSR